MVDTKEEYKTVIPPSPYINLIIPINNSVYERNNSLISKPQIQGVSTVNTYINYPKNTQLIGIRFYAFGAYPFFQIKGNNIVNSSVEFLPETKSFSGKNLPSSINEVDYISQLLTALFCEKSLKSIEKIQQFYQQFRWNDSVISIEDYCKEKGTNYTTFNRQFTGIVGLSPKKFERLLKFRKSLCNVLCTNESLTSIALESGYFDQAHFIREFKTFLNKTPSSYQSNAKSEDFKTKVINYNFKLF